MKFFNLCVTDEPSGSLPEGLYVAGLYAKSPAMASCVVASQANKRAREELEKKCFSRRVIY